MTISNPPIDEAVWSMTDSEYAIWLESSPHAADYGQFTPQLVVSNRILNLEPIPPRI